MNKIKSAIIAVFLSIFGVLLYAGNPHIESVYMWPPNPGFGDAVQVTVTYCGQLYADHYIDLAISSLSTRDNADVSGSGQIFLVSRAGIDVPTSQPALSPGGQIGYRAQTLPGAMTPDCATCGSGSDDGKRFTKVYNLHVPPRAYYPGCSITTLYLHVGMKDANLNSGEWTSLAACQVNPSVISWPVPVMAKNFEISKRVEGVLMAADDLVLYSVDYKYWNGALLITDTIPGGGNFSLESWGPRAITGAAISGPAIGVTSGTFSWDLPDRTGLPGAASGTVWMLLKMNNNAAAGTVFSNIASGAMAGVTGQTASASITVGQAAINITKGQSEPNPTYGSNITYYLSYQVSGSKLLGYQPFDDIPVGTYGSLSGLGGTAVPGWSFLAQSGDVGEWKILDMCNTGDRIIRGDVTLLDRFPMLLYDGLPVTNNMCNGTLVVDTMIEPNGYEGADASIVIRSDGLTSGNFYSLILSTDDFIGTNSTGHIGFQKCQGLSCIWPMSSNTVAVTNNKWWRVKIEVAPPPANNQYSFRAKVWAKGDPEPAAWTITWTDPVPQAGFDCNNGQSWKPGFGEQHGATGDISDYYDNFKVYAPSVAASTTVWDTIPAGVSYMGQQGPYPYTGNAIAAKWNLGTISDENGTFTWWGTVYTCSEITNEALISGPAPMTANKSNRVIAVPIGCGTAAPTSTAFMTITPTFTQTSTSLPVTATMAATFTITATRTITSTTTRTVTPTFTLTPLPAPASGPFNLEISTSTDPCSQNSLSGTLRIWNNNGFGAAQDMTGLTVRMWFNVTNGKTLVADNISNFIEPWNASGITVTISTSASIMGVECPGGPRSANQYVEFDVVSTNPVLVEPSRNIRVDFVIHYSDYSTPFDVLCDDYSRLQNFSMGNSPYVALYQNGVLVAEEISSGIPDPLTGVPPCSIPTPIASVSRTFTPTVTTTRTITPTFTQSFTMTATPTISVTQSNFTGGPVVVYPVPGDNGGRTTCVDPNGNILVVGLEWDGTCTCYIMVIYRYLPDGTLDTSFGTGGRMACPGPQVHYSWEDSMTIKCDSMGRIVVIGYSDTCGGTCADVIIYRFLQDGSPDNTFNGGQCWRTYNDLAGGNGNDYAYDFDFDENGKMVCTGKSWNGTDYDAIIFRCNSDGSPDTTFGPGGCRKVSKSCGKKITCRGGKIYVIAESESTDPGCTGECRSMCVWKYNDDGTPDASFASSCYINTAIGHSNCRPKSIMITTGGKIVVISTVDDGSGCTIVCKRMIITVFNPDGTPDTTFNGTGMLTDAGGTDGRYVLEIDGKIVVCYIRHNGTDTDCVVKRFNMDGSVDTTFDGDGEMVYDSGSDDECYSILRLTICRLIAAGHTYNIGTGYDMILWNIEDMCPANTPTSTSTVTPTSTITPINTLTPTYTVTPTFTVSQTTVPSSTPTRTQTQISALSCWVDADGTGRESINITMNSEPSVPSMELDAGNMPHVLWTNAGKLYLLQWNGSVWVDIDGAGQESTEIPVGAVAVASTNIYVHDMVLDSSGNPGIIFTGTEMAAKNIYYIKWNGSVWVDADGTGLESMNISNSAADSENPRIKLDTLGNPNAVWKVNGQVAYLKWNGTAWVDADGIGQESKALGFTDNVNYGPFMSLDQFGNPNISYDNYAAVSSINFTKWNGSSWVDADGVGLESLVVKSTAAPTLVRPVLILDNLGRPHIVYNLDGMYSTLNYLKWNGSSWVDADGSGQESSMLYMPASGDAQFQSVGLDSSGNISIAWGQGLGSNSDIYLLKWNGSSWVDEDGSGQESINISGMTTSTWYNFPILKIDSSGMANVAWTALQGVYYEKWNCSLPTATPTSTVTPTFTVSRTTVPSSTPTCACVITNTVTPTRTITQTFTISPSLTLTVVPTATVTSTIPCGFAATPVFSVEMIFNPESNDNDIFNITSNTALISAPYLTVHPHGQSLNKPALTFLSALIPAETMKYRVLYPKQTGYGDVDYVEIAYADPCGMTATAIAQFEKSVISQKDVQLFKNVINPDSGERTRIAFKIYGGDHVTVKIYSRTGVLIKEVYEGDVSGTGWKEVTWDGTNKENEKVASGVYYVVVDSDFYTVKEKIAVVR